jgi:hypothetical protein
MMMPRASSMSTAARQARKCLYNNTRSLAASGIQEASAGTFKSTRRAEMSGRFQIVRPE